MFQEGLVFSAAVCMNISASSFSERNGTVLLRDSATFRLDTVAVIKAHIWTLDTLVSCDVFIAVANHLGQPGIA